LFTFTGFYFTRESKNWQEAEPMKRSKSNILTGMLVVSVLLAGCGGGVQPTATKAAEAPKPIELNISAAVSMKDALAEIQTNYQKKAPHVKLLYNLGASGSLQKQIEQGAPADIFISAAPKQMNELEEKNLVNKATRKNLIENKLVLVVPKNSTLNLSKYEDLQKDEVKQISIGETKVVPAGQYAEQVLKKMAIWDKVQSKIVFAKDVRTVLTYVETGNVAAGIVYKTDAASSSKVKIVATAPEGSHAPIIYPAAVLTGSKNAKAAEEFLAYMAGPEGKPVFEKHGFLMGN
jgi:molybdate transport system substrate-binding protein